MNEDLYTTNYNSQTPQPIMPPKKRVTAFVFASIFLVVAVLAFAIGLSMMISGITLESDELGDGLGKALLLIYGVLFLSLGSASAVITIIFSVFSHKSCNGTIKLVSLIYYIVAGVIIVVSIVMIIILQSSSAA